MPVALVSPRQGYIKIGKEAVTRGVAAATMTSLDVDSRSVGSRQERIKPQTLTNSVSDLLEVVQGRKWADGDISGRVRTDTFGHLLMAIFGADAITGAGPYTHAFTVNSTTPSYTIEKNIGGLSGASNSEQLLNMVCSRLVISGTPEDRNGEVTFAATFIGKHGTKITATAYTKPTVKPIPAALAVFSYGGSGVTTELTAWQVAFERIVTPAQGASNALDLDDAVATIFRVSGFLDAYFLNWTRFYDDFVANTQRAISLTSATGAADSLQIVTTGAYLSDHAPEEGGDVVKQRVNFDAIFNATDTGAAKVTLLNSVAVAF